MLKAHKSLPSLDLTSFKSKWELDLFDRLLNFNQETQNTRKKRILLLSGLVLLLISAGAVWYINNSSLWSEPTTYPKVETAVLAVYGTGEVEPVIWAKLSAEASGRLMKLLVQEGDEVKQNQVLAHLDDSVERATLEEMNARLTYYEQDRKRKEELTERDFSSKLALQQAIATHEELLARVQAQKERINRLAIKTPIAGTVLRREGELGELIQRGQTVFWIGQPDNLQIVASIDEEEISGVAIGQRVLIKADAFPDQVLEGRVHKITLMGDPVAKTFRVRIELPRNTRLLVGMTVEVNVILREERNSIMVPVTSVFEGIVYKKVGRSIEPVKVKTGINDGENIQIIAGINSKDEIIIDAVQAKNLVEK